MNQQPDWKRIESDVLLRIRILAAAWDGTSDQPLHEQMVRDLYLPCLRLLGKFCGAIEVGDEHKPQA